MSAHWITKETRKLQNHRTIIDWRIPEYWKTQGLDVDKMLDRLLTNYMEQMALYSSPVEIVKIQTIDPDFHF